MKLAYQLCRLVEQIFAENPSLSRPMTTRQLAVLEHIVVRNGAKPKELSAYLRFSGPSVTRCLKVLRELDAIQTGPIDHDLRTFECYATEKGKKLIYDLNSITN